MPHAQVATSEWYFPRWQNFPNVQFPKRQLPKSVQAAALAPPRLSSRGARLPAAHQRHNLTFGKLSLEKLHIWEVATWEIVTWKVTLGKMP